MQRKKDWFRQAKKLDKQRTKEINNEIAIERGNEVEINNNKKGAL